MNMQAVNPQKRTERKTLWQIFRAPTWLGVLSLVGLIAALIGDGWHDVLSWLGLGIPVVLTLWYGWWNPRRQR